MGRGRKGQGPAKRSAPSRSLVGATEVATTPAWRQASRLPSLPQTPNHEGRAQAPSMPAGHAAGILSRMSDPLPESPAAAPTRPRALVGWRLLALFYDLWP